MSVSAPLGVGKHILPFQGRLKAVLPQLEEDVWLEQSCLAREGPLPMGRLRAVLFHSQTASQLSCLH